MGTNKFPILCTRCCDLREPDPDGAEKGRCAGCGCKIWVVPATLAAAKKHYPRGEVSPICSHCAEKTGLNEEPTQILPEQIEMLRSSGLSDEKIAVGFALSDVANGDIQRMEEITQEILADPNGTRAVAFRAAVQHARLAIRLTQGPHLN